MIYDCLTGEHTSPKHDLPPLVIGIDPDGSGALAAIQVQALPHPDAQEIQNVDVQLHDNPIEIFQGATRKRRLASITADLESPVMRHWAKDWNRLNFCLFENAEAALPAKRHVHF